MFQIICLGVGILTIIMGINAILLPTGIQLTRDWLLTGGAAKKVGALVVLLGMGIIAFAIWGLGLYLRVPG